MVVGGRGEVRLATYAFRHRRWKSDRAEIQVGQRQSLTSEADVYSFFSISCLKKKERAVQKSHLWVEGAFDIYSPVTAAQTI